MKRLKEKSHKKLYIFAPVLAVAAIGGGIWLVYALSHSNSVVQNEIPVAVGTVRIVDDSDPGFGKKEISFVNDSTNSIPVFLRIGYSETWKDSNDTIINNIYNGNNVVTKTWTSDFTDDFVAGNDGWYYYKKLLNPDASVQVITGISLNEPSYAAYDYDLNFRFEAIQADADAATALWSKTATIDGSTGAVTWAF